jgi:hypothetical protein
MILFRNNKRKDDTHPVMRGELLLSDVTYEVALWPKKDRNGDPFWVGAAKVKGPKPDERRPPKFTERQDGEFDSEIPF